MTRDIAASARLRWRLKRPPARMRPPLDQVDSKARAVDVARHLSRRRRAGGALSVADHFAAIDWLRLIAAAQDARRNVSPPIPVAASPRFGFDDTAPTLCAAFMVGSAIRADILFCASGAAFTAYSATRQTGILPLPESRRLHDAFSIAAADTRLFRMRRYSLTCYFSLLIS